MGLLPVSSLAPHQVTPKRLTGAGTNDLVYQVPVGGLFIVKAAVVVNITNNVNLSASAFGVLVSVMVVPAGGDVTDGTNEVMSQYLLGAGDTQSLPKLESGDPLGPGDAVYARAEVAPGNTTAAGAANVLIGGWLGAA